MSVIERIRGTKVISSWRKGNYLAKAGILLIVAVLVAGGAVVL